MATAEAGRPFADQQVPCRRPPLQLPTATGPPVTAPHLAVPAQLLQALGLDAVANGLGRQEACTGAHTGITSEGRGTPLLGCSSAPEERRRQAAGVGGGGGRASEAVRRRGLELGCPAVCCGVLCVLCCRDGAPPHPPAVRKLTILAHRGPAFSSTSHKWQASYAKAGTLPMSCYQAATSFAQAFWTEASARGCGGAN